MESQLPQPQTFGTDAEESYLHPRRPLPIGHLLHKRYRITGVLSDNGGFSITYRAVDTYRDLNLDVVVKENFPLNVAARHPETLQLSPLRGMEEHFTKTLQRFEEEAELLATLNHPNIVRVSAHFSELNTAYYVMPHIGGIELYRALPPADELSEAELKPVLRSLLEALQYIHDFKLLHRDIKPNNVLLDTKSTPILIDFGLVRSTDTFRTLTRNYTPGYAPVEQISGSGKSGPWTDMYSLGATCYALITGSAPPDSLARLEDDEYTPLLSQPELLNRYSPSLLAGIDRALQMKRADRWQNAQEWMENLNAAEPASVPAPPPQQPEPVLSQQEARRLLQKQKISPNIYDTQLRMAAKAGNSKQLRLLIAAGANVKKVDRRTYSPLYLAIRHDHIECVKLLIEAGADVNKANKDGSTPLYGAAEKPNTECVKLLIEAGADVNMATNDDSTPLHKAAENGRSECVKLLIEAGADVNKFDWTPLYAAACHGHTECVKLLIEAGAKVNTEEEYDISPLTLAADWGYTECMRLLLDAGGRANTQDDDGNTPLHKVAENGHSECVTLLLEAIDIDVNKENTDGNTPLHMAAENGHSECVTLLLEAIDIDVNKENADGNTPLHMAAENGHSECVTLLLEAIDIDVNKENADGNTPLHMAAENGHSECVTLLLEAIDIDVNQANALGRTPLHVAAENDHSECVTLLLEAPGIDVNKADESGSTPLNLAIECDNSECVHLLKKAGGKTNKSLFKWLTIIIVSLGTILFLSWLIFGYTRGIFYAADSGYSPLLRSYLILPGIDINKADKNGSTPLYQAILKGHTECAKLLINAGADVNKAEEFGWTPLHRAATDNHPEYVKLLIDAGADVNRATHQGRTPLYWAAYFGNTKCVKLLLDTPGIDINKSDENGRTPLNEAESQYNSDCTQLIREAVERREKDLRVRTLRGLDLL